MTEVFQTARAMAKRRAIHREAALAGTVVVLCLLLVAVLFPPEAAAAVRVWIASRTFNHCFIILPLTLFMIWQRRNAIGMADFAPTLWGAAAVLAVSLSWTIASFAGVLELEQFVIITMLQSVLFAIFGWRLYRKLAGPLLYLYFLVPSGAFLIPFLQSFTARFTVAGLHLLGIPVFSTGAVIEIPAGTFAIAEACAGLRFLVASVAFGVFFAIVTYRSTTRRATFILLSVIVPIVANGFRALGLIAAAQWIGSPAAALADHILYGWIFFSIVLVILVVIGHLFSDQKAAASGLPKFVAAEPPEKSALGKMGLVAAICVVAALPGPLAAAVILAPRALELPRSAPQVLPPWRSIDLRPDWQPMLVHPSRTFAETFVLGKYRIDRYVALYDGNSRTSNLVRSANREADERVWTFNSGAAGELSVSGRSMPVRVSTWLRGPERRKVWSFYLVNGRPAATALGAKWEQLKGDFARRPCASAYVAFSVEKANPVSDASVAQLLAATEPFEPYLCQTR